MERNSLTTSRNSGSKTSPTSGRAPPLGRQKLLSQDGLALVV
jgi:hypothetical protein